MVKQLVTIDAALLTFGIAFVQNISKAHGPTGWIDAATIALLVSVAFGTLALYRVVSETHSATGDINDGILRIALVLALLGFVAALAFITYYVLHAPIPIPK